MNTARRIVEAIDRHLAGRTEIVVFGSAALLLDPGFAPHLGARMTNDVDIIIPDAREMMVDADQSFWAAIEAANKELEPEGLYITHIFPEREVALTPEWQEHTVRLAAPYLEKLSLVRPRVLDLVVSKMGRGDTQDVDDVRSMLRLEQAVSGHCTTAADVIAAADRARVPDVYREIFHSARQKIVAAVQEFERTLTLGQSIGNDPIQEKPRQSRGPTP